MFQNGNLPQLTEQEFANLQNLHVINCMSNMSKEQFMQTINMIQSVLHFQQSAPVIENDALELQARYHRTAAGKKLQFKNMTFVSICVLKCLKIFR